MAFPLTWLVTNRSKVLRPPDGDQRLAGISRHDQATTLTVAT